MWSNEDTSRETEREMDEQKISTQTEQKKRTKSFHVT